MELWIPVTLAAAFSQNLRNALQKTLKGRLSTWGATASRFVFAAPLAVRVAHTPHHKVMTGSDAHYHESDGQKPQRLILAEFIDNSIYLAQLCIRLTQGADFIGRYYIYKPPTPGDAEPTASRQAVWYDAECLVTNCTISVEATQAIRASVDFVTTGPIKLLTGVPRSFLLQEDSSFLLLEQSQDFGRIVLAGQDV